MFVVPAEGLKVRMPGSRQFLPSDGAEVPNTAYWIRRLRDGDVAKGGKVGLAKTDAPHHSATAAAGGDKAPATATPAPHASAPATLAEAPHHSASAPAAAAEKTSLVTGEARAAALSQEHAS